ncbi:hypothetical protein A2U01_0003672 [Trifolium medium]|uniref:Uncharacterized protein n=1 Tax=Trifolium medium TaxID=97028 RepID=A0A392M627_9FABA|nr:hypothetical protein [Trifolium medium]
MIDFKFIKMKDTLVLHKDETRLRHHLNPIASARVGEMWISSDLVVANRDCPLWSRISKLQQDFSPSKQPVSIEYAPIGGTTTHQEPLPYKD